MAWLDDDLQNYMNADVRSILMSEFSKVVYILDDDAGEAGRIAAYLRELSCESIIIRDGREGLARIKKDPPDLVLMDLLLPRISGFDILKKIRRSRKTAGIPVIISSAFLSEKTEEGNAILVGDDRIMCDADFIIVKPVEEAKLHTAVEQLLFDRLPKTPEEDETRLRILIAEDNEDNLELLRLRLDKSSHDVFTAVNGNEAVDQFFRVNPDVVFLDIQMPDKNGLQVLEEIRSRENTCTVIMMTAFGSEDIAVRSLKLGANDYLTKPIDYRGILKVLEENVKQTRLRNRNKQLFQQLKVVNRELYRKYALLQEAIAHIEAGQEKVIKAQRISAITETAVSLNHEINNPLCSIMGNAELLAMMLTDADEKVKRKLEIISRESIRIHETTKKLSNLMQPVLTEYIHGVQMIDVSKSR